MIRRCAVLAIALVALVAGCTAPDRTSPAPIPTTSPNTTDIAWLQLLIAMNERLLPVLDLASGRASDPAVQKFVSLSRQARQAELVSLHGLAAGVTMPTDNPHLQHDMPGMTTAAQRDALARTRGNDFERKLTAAVRAHLDQASRLCAGERNAGADPAFRSLAETIARSVDEERARASALDARAASLSPRPG